MEFHFYAAITLYTLDKYVLAGRRIDRKHTEFEKVNLIGTKYSHKTSSKILKCCAGKFLHV